MKETPDRNPITVPQILEYVRQGDGAHRIVMSDVRWKNGIVTSIVRFETRPGSDLEHADLEVQTMSFRKCYGLDIFRNVIVPDGTATYIIASDNGSFFSFYPEDDNHDYYEAQSGIYALASAKRAIDKRSINNEGQFMIPANLSIGTELAWRKEEVEAVGFRTIEPFEMRVRAVIEDSDGIGYDSRLITIKDLKDPDLLTFKQRGRYLLQD
jgi:hypothetical protein